MPSLCVVLGVAQVLLANLRQTNANQRQQHKNGVSSSRRVAEKHTPLLFERVPPAAFVAWALEHWKGAWDSGCARC